MQWKPNPGPQERFCASSAFEVLYGGAAGGGKSDALLGEALRFVHIPGYRAIYFRRTYPELEGKGSGIIPRSRELLHDAAKYDEQRHLWLFSSGATLAFAHLEHEHTVHNYRSAQFAYIAFDELTTFTESQYLYLFSRCRSTVGVPACVRSASNPGGVGHMWVRRRFIEKLRPFEVRYFKRQGDDDVETGREDSAGLGRQFIPARLVDNPALMEKDPGYLRRLLALDPVDRARLLDGDWFVANAGLVYGTFSDLNLTDSEPDPDLGCELAFDDGYMDPRAFLLIQRTGSRILIFDELYHTRHLGETCIGELLALLARHGFRPRGLGGPIDLAAGSPEAVELREYMRRADIPTRGGKVGVVEGIKAVRSLISEGALQVHRRCTHLLSELREGYQYAPEGGEVPLDQDNHACDALRYWVWLRAR